MPIYLLILVVAAKILISSLLTTVAVKTIKDRHINIANYLPGRIQIDHVDSDYVLSSQDGLQE
jgi:hypothetical protein